MREPAPGAKADDCAIFVLLGREILRWGEVPPDVSQFAVFYSPEAGGYVEQCPWAELGVIPLAPGKPDLDRMRFFTAPAYGDDGTTATVSFVTKLVARDGAGRAKPPFISQEELSLAKTDGRWRLIARRQGPMT